MTKSLNRRAFLGALVGVLGVFTLAAKPPQKPHPHPTPTPTATPTPTPTATPTPTTPPVGIPVPASIDSTGATDASSALQAWLATVPNGSTVVFKAGGTYRMNIGLEVSGRTGLTLDGNGATLRSYGDTAGPSTLITLWGSARTTIRNFNLVGNSPTPGQYSLTGEWAHGIRMYQSTDTDIYGVTVSAVWGHGIFVSDDSRGVHFHDSRIASCGVMGFAIISGRDIIVERNAFDTIGYGLFDIEPFAGTEVTDNVTFRDNTAGVINQPKGKRFFFGANGDAGSVSNITCTRNTITGSPLDTYVNVLPRRQNIVFTDNTSTVTTFGPVVEFAHIDGLTYSGNVQPLSSGPLYSVIDCTNVNP